jgi:phage-related protein
MSKGDKPLAWLHGEVKTPPFSQEARIDAGVLLRTLQQGLALGLPHSRPMPSVGARCHELRVPDADQTWRIVYRLDVDAVIVLAGLRQEDADHAELYPEGVPTTPPRL